MNKNKQSNAWRVNHTNTLKYYAFTHTQRQTDRYTDTLHIQKTNIVVFVVVIQILKTFSSSLLTNTHWEVVEKLFHDYQTHRHNLLVEVTISSACKNGVKKKPQTI